MTTIRFSKGGSPSNIDDVKQPSPQPLALPGPRLLQQAPGKASEEAVSCATGLAVVHHRHQSPLSTQLPLQLTQSCLVSALRAGTEKQPQRVFFIQDTNLLNSAPFSLHSQESSDAFSRFKEVYVFIIKGIM